MESVSTSPLQWTKDWWRWPLVPFAAVVGLLIAWGIATVGLWLQMKFIGGFGEDGWYFRFIVPALASGAAGWGFSTGACMVAPRGQKFAGTVMVTLLALVGLLSVVIAWTSPNFDAGAAIQTTLIALITQGAAIATVVLFEP